MNNNVNVNMNVYAPDEILAIRKAFGLYTPVADFTLYIPKKIIQNGPATIVFWIDGTKTVVKCAEGDTNDIYFAFTTALAKKIFGSNSKIKKVLKTKVEVQSNGHKS